MLSCMKFTENAWSGCCPKTEKQPFQNGVKSEISWQGRANHVLGHHRASPIVLLRVVAQGQQRQKGSTWKGPTSIQWSQILWNPLKSSQIAIWWSQNLPNPFKCPQKISGEARDFLSRFDRTWEDLKPSDGDLQRFERIWEDLRPMYSSGCLSNGYTFWVVERWHRDGEVP